jgi:RNA polymerase sigma-70 factor (ECF subfamily)
VELYREQIYGIAWQLTHRREDALDVTQEAFVRMWHALGSYQGKSRFSTWLHRIVLNTGIDYIRRESRHSHVSIDAPEDNDSGASGRHHVPEPSAPAAQRDHIYERQLQRTVLAALGQLSHRQRQVFVLRYYHGLSLREIAEIIHATDGTVKSHLARAQVQLRNTLGHLRNHD